MATKDPACAAGDEALTRGEWTVAREAFDASLEGGETPEALEGLGLAAWWLDLADVVFDSRERAYNKTLPVGGFALMPAGMNHFAYTTQETTIVLYGQGPVEFKYVNPADDPRTPHGASK